MLTVNLIDYNHAMKPTYKLNSLDKLKAMQASLNTQQKALEKQIVSTGKTALVTLPVVWLLKPSDPLKIIKVDGKINISGKVFSYLLPLVVNQTLFRRSGFLTKIIMAIIALRHFSMICFYARTRWSYFSGSARWWS